MTVSPPTSSLDKSALLPLAALALLAACGGEETPPATDTGDTGSTSGGSTAQGPATQITAQPASVSKDPFAAITFSASGASGFECSLDGATFEACSSPFTMMPLAVGSHRVQVRAIGSDGTTGAASEASWTVSSIFGDEADGSVHPDLVATTVMPAPVAPNSWRGIMRINCDFSHSSYDDPIVFPGQNDAAHLHRFYGNTLTDENSDAQSLFTTGESSCQGNTLNRSSYWVPALLAPLYNQATGERALDASGQPAWQVVRAVVGNDDEAHEVFYYSAGVSDLASIQPIPFGLKMIAGSPSGQPGAEQDTSIVRWHCQTWESSEATNPRWSTSIPECLAPDRLRMDIFFPSCWNGTDLDSADHKSHLAYPVAQGSQTVCPASHPVPIVRVSYHYAFGVTPDVYDPATFTSKGWRLASDMYDVGASAAGGMSLHGDWFNGWHPEALQALLDGCIKRGLDCHDGNLANGYRLTGVREGTQYEPPIINMGHGG